MPIDIELERKFLVADRDALRLELANEGSGMVQGYPLTKNGLSLRVRVASSQEMAFLTIKGPRQGVARREAECAVPINVGRLLIDMCDGLISKTRYPAVGPDGHLWSIDVFHQENDGLLLAEVELTDPDENVAIPAWCGEEVTDDERYYNEYLVQNPYSSWNLE